MAHNKFSTTLRWSQFSPDDNFTHFRFWIQIFPRAIKLEPWGLNLFMKLQLWAKFSCFIDFELFFFSKVWLKSLQSGNFKSSQFLIKVILRLFLPFTFSQISQPILKLGIKSNTFSKSEWTGLMEFAKRL